MRQVLNSVILGFTLLHEQCPPQDKNGCYCAQPVYRSVDVPHVWVVSQTGDICKWEN